MKRIIELNDEYFGLNSKPFEQKELRFAARAIVLKEDKIALVHMSKDNYYKIPGGGIEDGESVKEGLVREVEEESGCQIKITDEVGEIVEHRSKYGMLQTSYCYIGKVLSEGKTNFTQNEINSGSKIIWVPLDEAIKLMESSNKEDYNNLYMATRDLIFVKEAKKLLS